MGLWELVLPQSTVNLVTNPSLELNTTGWTATAGSIARSTAYQRFGLYSLLWTPTTGANDSVYFGTVPMVDGATYTFSVYINVTPSFAGVPMRIYVGSTGGAVLGTPTTFVATGDWQRVSVTYQQGSPDASRRLYIGKNGSSFQPSVYIDGAQCEGFDTGTWTGSFAATTYCDGSIPGCTWSALPHASTSSRSAQTALGGLAVNLDAFNVYVSDWAGAGMPAINNVATDLAMAEGAVFQRSLAKPRVFTLRLTAYNPNGAGSLAGLHAIRQMLIDASKPDRLGRQQPFILQYSGGGKTIRIAAFYDAGMEWGERKGFSQEIALRCIAYDPYWYSEFDDGATLTASSSITSAAYILRRSTSGVWSKLGTGLNGIPRCAYRSPDGTLYVGGSFTTAGGTTVNRVAKWNGFSWSAMGSTGVAGGGATVYAIVGDGTDSGCYVVGDFTTAGGVTCNNVARWNGSSWSALGGTPGTNGIVYDAVLHPNGSLFIVGAFTTAGGGTRNRIAEWNGSSWTTFGTTGLSGGISPTGYNIVLMPSGQLLVSGLFTTVAGPVAALNCAIWDVSLQVWTAAGNNAGATVYGQVAVMLDGSVVSGSIVFIDPITGSPAVPSFYNGATWSRLEPLSTTPPDVITLAGDPLNRGVYLAGATFTTIGGQSVTRGLAYWNSSYVPMDVAIPADSYLLQPFSDGSLIVGFNGSVTALAAGQTTVTNEGTAAAFPRISITGPGQLYSVVNQTTGDVLYFNNLTLGAGETLVIDLRVGVKTFISNYRNCLVYVSPTSNISTFRLLPGDNSIAVLVNNASASASMVWTERHWSIDGGSA